jgi:hypothetical protein
MKLVDVRQFLLISMQIACGFILKALRLHLRNNFPFFIVHCTDFCTKQHRKKKTICKGVMEEDRIHEITCSE